MAGSCSVHNFCWCFERYHNLALLDLSLDEKYLVLFSHLTPLRYWGKRDADLNLPINSSISVTLDQGELCTITTVT